VSTTFETASIFISYRIADTLREADRLAAELRRKFGSEAVFFDRRTLEAGDQWDSRIDTAVTGAAVVLALIGKKWLTEQNEYGVRRLDVPDDWVRRELEAALLKAGRVVPVFVDDASPPPKEAFKGIPGLMALSSCQGTSLRTREWDRDFGVLVDLLASKGLAFVTEAGLGPSTVALHVLNAKSRVPHWSEAAEVRFSLTNLGKNAAKLTGLELQVLKRAAIQKVAFRKAGAPVAEFQLEATIGVEDRIELLDKLGTQFILAPGSSDAFNLALRGPEGFLIEYRLRVCVYDLARKHESEIESETLQVEYPVRSLKVLKERSMEQ